jgi:adenylate cyclase
VGAVRGGAPAAPGHGALEHLSDWHEKQGNVARAIEYAWRQVELEPWREEAHQQVMRLLALGGQRSAALAQYRTCCRLLAEGLAAEPSSETVRLYEQIRDGQISVRPEPPRQVETRLALPSFLTGQRPPVTRPTFVAREKELAWLDGLLKEALAGRGQAGFVVGGPGRGKTALLQEFARRALDAHPDLLLALGTCNAYSGLGDPYLPFRAALAMLTGDAEALWAAGILSASQARRLWHALPEVVPVLARWGSGLVGSLLPAQDLLRRARAVAPPDETAAADWLSPLERLVDPRTSPPGGLEQSHLFEQYANVLLHLSEQQPLLVIVDDLQWADLASVGLLFHLGRRIEAGRILLAGAYRPDEVAVGREEQRHPLEPVLAEFRARFGDAWLDLAVADEAEGHLFVDRLLDSEPNTLDERFRQALFGRTRGHPLFTLELLRAMQQRGDLVRDRAGRWAPGGRVEWDTLPARAEAAIAERIDRLPEELREMLAVASVEGEEFTAQTVALVLGLDELHILRTLRRQLAARHRLVRELGELHLDGQSLSRYRLSHFLGDR